MLFWAPVVWSFPTTREIFFLHSVHFPGEKSRRKSLIKWLRPSLHVISQKVLYFFLISLSWIFTLMSRSLFPVTSKRLGLKIRFCDWPSPPSKKWCLPTIYTLGIRRDLDWFTLMMKLSSEAGLATGQEQLLTSSFLCSPDSFLRRLQRRLVFQWRVVVVVVVCKYENRTRDVLGFFSLVTSHAFLSVSFFSVVWRVSE